MKLKGAIIGVSGYGNVHYTDLMQFCKDGRMEFVGATVINRDQEQEKCAVLESMGCKIYDDYKVMLQDLSGKIDFCTIPTGILMHKEMTVEALRHGVHVLVEKPAAPDMESLQIMQDAASGSDRITAIGFQFNYQQNTRELKELLLSGKLGRIRRLRGLCLWPRNNEYYARNNWSGKRILNGRVVNDAPFSNATAHYLMLLLYFAGIEQNKGAMPVSVNGNLWRVNPEIESCDAAELHYQLDNGLTLDYVCSHACRNNINPILEIECEQGKVVWTLPETCIYTADGCRKIPHPIGAFESRQEMWQAFLDKVSGKETEITGLELAGCHTKAVDLAFQTLPIQDVTDKTEIIREDPSYRYIFPEFDTKFETYLNL